MFPVENNVPCGGRFSNRNNSRLSCLKHTCGGRPGRKLHTKSKKALGNDLFFQPFATEDDKGWMNLGMFNSQGFLTT